MPTQVPLQGIDLHQMASQIPLEALNIDQVSFQIPLMGMNIHQVGVQIPLKGMHFYAVTWSLKTVQGFLKVQRIIYPFRVDDAIIPYPEPLKKRFLTIK